MRFLIPVSICVVCFVLSGGQSIAQQDADKNAKRIAEIQKELADLKERIAKLTAELAQLQATPLVQPERMNGTIIKLIAGGDMPKEFLLGQGPHIEGIFVSLRKDTQIVFSDKQKAKPSDLKIGYSVNISGRFVQFSQPRKAEADVIIIEKRAREILAWKNAGEIAKQVDFTREYLVLFRWTGWSGYAQDHLSFTVEEDKDGPMVVFDFCRPVRMAGMAKVTQQAEQRLYVIAKNARFFGGPPGKMTKITTAAELAKAFPDMK